MQARHLTAQASHEHEAQAKVHKKQKVETSANTRMHESQPLEGIISRIGDGLLACRPVNERQKIQSLLRLQRHYGNRSVQRVIAQHIIQTRLSVRQPGDSYEQEADRVADAVMQMPQPRSGAEAPFSGRVQALRIQRLCAGCEEELRRQPIEEEKEELHRQPMEEEEEKPIQTKAISNGMDMTIPRQIGNEEENEEQSQPSKMVGRKYLSIPRQADEEEEKEENKSVQAKSTVLPQERDQVGEQADSHLSQSKGGGQPLPYEVKDFMEPRFGFNFDQVRIHNDTAAADSAKSIGAAAYTSEQDIYFDSGQYQPDTIKGKELIAHELVHVVQQTKDRIERLPNGGKSDNPGESQADRGVQRVKRNPDSEGNQRIASSIRPYQRSSVQLLPHVAAVAAGPAELAAGRGRTARARATVGGGIAPAWSIDVPDHGATIVGAGRNATITAPAGSTGGVITIRAADPANAGDSATANVTLVEVRQPTFVFAPPMPVGAAANTMDAPVCDNRATANAVTVPGLRPVRWSIRGNARGATIDAATGAINPSATQTGAITVRATDNAVPDAFADQILTIRAHPTKIIRTINTGAIPAAAGGPYGAVYDHIFQSSGGSLLNVDVSERVFNTNDPFNTGFAPVVPGPPNIWPLNAAGRMIGDFMWTPSGTPGIDVNQFLPRPPNPGLPQTFHTPQILYWRSIQCGGQWVPFANVTITATLLRRGANFRFVTINNGIVQDEPYIGPALAAAPAVASVCPPGVAVSRVRLTPSLLAADSNATTTSAATAQVRPAATALQWSFPGTNFGAVIVTPTPGAGNPAQIRTGNVGGDITVRAAVVGTPGCFAEGRLTLRRVHIGPIQFKPAVVPAGGGNRALATIGTRPGQRDVNWTIVGPALGCLITRNPDNSANIVRGPQRGRITVRATDQRDATKFTEATLVLS